MKSSVTLTRRSPRIVARLEPRSKRRFATPRSQVSRDHSPTPERLMQFAWGYAPPLILEAALNHRLFDLLDQAPQTRRRIGCPIRGFGARVDRYPERPGGFGVPGKEGRPLRADAGERGLPRLHETGLPRRVLPARDSANPAELVAVDGSRCARAGRPLRPTSRRRASSSLPSLSRASSR